MSSTTPETPHLNVHPHAESDGIGWIHQIFDVMSKNRGATIGLVVTVIAVGAAGTWLSSRNDAKSEDAYNQLFLARKTVSEELKALAQAKTPEAKTDAKTRKDTSKDVKTAAPATEESVRYDRFDVDAKLPKSVKELQALASGPYSNTRAAYEAKLVLGNLYFDHGDSARAAQAFAGAVASAPTAQEKAMAYSAQGRALENATKYAEALDAYGKAIAIVKDSQAIQGELMLAQARCHELLKDTVKARAVYDQILSQMPASEYAKTAESLKARLQ